MIKEIGHVKNPLTIIAIFAAIAEIFGTGVLPFIEPTNQGTFIWFLMLFPFALITAFFITLNFNHKVLYAPSDFSSDETFYKIFLAKQATPSESLKKLNEEVAEINSPIPPLINSTEDETKTLNAMSLSRIEELAFNRILKEFPGDHIRGVSFGSETISYTFDGIIAPKTMGNYELLLVEIKYVTSLARLKKTLDGLSSRIHKALSQPLPASSVNYKKTVLIVMVTDVAVKNYDKISDAVIDEFKDSGLNYMVKVLDESMLGT